MEGSDGVHREGGEEGKWVGSLVGPTWCVEGREVVEGSDSGVEKRVGICWGVCGQEVLFQLGLVMGMF